MRETEWFITPGFFFEALSYIPASPLHGPGQDIGLGPE
jgi:hypothetical protein